MRREDTMSNYVHGILQYEIIMIIFILEPQALVTVSEPDLVNFCEISCYHYGTLKNQELPYAMRALTAMKHLNFRVHPPSLTSDNGSRYVLYLCEHMGDGADWTALQSTLRNIVQGTLISANMRCYHTPDNHFIIRWTCG
jgi:hypothetical protein